MIEKSDYDALFSLKIFENIAKNDVEFYNDKFNIRSFMADDIILSMPAKEQKMGYFIVQGNIRMMHCVPKVPDTCYYLLGPSMGFGFDSLFVKDFQKQHDTYNIISALDDVKLITIPLETLEEVLQNSKIMENFVKLLISISQYVVMNDTDRINQFRNREAI